jgi:hypothetical protein
MYIKSIQLWQELAPSFDHFRPRLAQIARQIVDSAMSGVKKVARQASMPL